MSGVLARELIYIYYIYALNVKRKILGELGWRGSLISPFPAHGVFHSQNIYTRSHACIPANLAPNRKRDQGSFVSEELENYGRTRGRQ